MIIFLIIFYIFGTGIFIWHKNKKIVKAETRDKINEVRKLTTLSDIQLNSEELNKFNQQTKDLIEKWKNKK